MGIQRLSQDLLPYAEDAIFGAASQASPEVLRIETLIIDGPSLVYFVYNKLLAYQSANSLTLAALPPTYDEINQGVHHLLGNLQNHGVYVPYIFFDGGLPVSKREVRLERMEKLRRQLETYRRSRMAVATPSVKVQDLEQILWYGTILSTRGLTLPPPPFMVASVIEALCTSSSEWSRRVRVVPDEADVYCALAARNCLESVAVLTNDSDLAIHDLGENGRVVLLHSLEKKLQGSEEKDSWIAALCLNPRRIAAELGVSSLLAFGFERSLDSSGSFAVIRDRARNPSSSKQRQSKYNTFAQEFVPSMTSIATAELKLDSVDPRTAEMIVNLGESAAHVYLTPVLEDPQRDSSWSYGVEMRQVAYSLVSMAGTRKGKARQAIKAFTEHMRKGQRIAPTQISTLDLPEISVQAAELQALLARYLPAANQPLLSADAGMILAWHALAIHVVHQQNVKSEKSPPTLIQALRVFGLAPSIRSSFNVPERVLWDDIHLLAHIQVVLYSLRMLRQVTQYIINNFKLDSVSAVVKDSQSDDGQKLFTITRRLHEMLSRMPSIADVFIDIPHLYRRSSEADIETQNRIIARLTGALAPGRRLEDATKKPVIRKAGRQAAGIEYENGGRVPTKPRKRTRKSRRPTEPAIVPTDNSNIFEILSQDKDWEA